MDFYQLVFLFWVRLFATVLVFYHSGFDLSSVKSTFFYRICKIDALHRLICQSITKITNIFDAYPHLSTLFHVVLHRFLLICLFSAFTFFSYRFFHALYILGRRSAGLVFFDFFRIFYWQWLIIMIKLSCKNHRVHGCLKQRPHYIFDYWDPRLSY